MAELKKHAVSVRDLNTDVDVEFTLNKPEVDTLASDTTKATILAFFTATLGPLGPIVTQYVSSHINDVQANSGPNGAYVKMTIRNGTSLHVWQVYPL